MSDYTTNFPPQTYSSSFYINSLVDGEKSTIFAKTNSTDRDGTKGAPLLDCFISAMSKVSSKIQKLFYFWIMLPILATDADKVCKMDNLKKTVTFPSLLELQGNKYSFDPDDPTYRGNIVDFNFKSIDRVPRNSFISFGSYSIIKISLNNKGIRIIDDGAFSNLFCLHYLELRQNNISNLTATVFNGMDNLQVLDLSENAIHTMNGMIFNLLYKLKTLNLSKNSIVSLNAFDFYNLTSLEVLNLSFNKISSISPDSFNFLRSLKELFLNNNQLMDIELEKWKNLNNLEMLNLAGNFLRKFDPTFNFSFIHLQNLNISRNSLNYLNVFELRRKLPYLKIIDIGLNDWDCDDLERMTHYLADSKITVLLDDVNCGRFKGYRRPTTAEFPSSTASSISTSTITALENKNSGDYLKKVFVQNDEVLSTTTKLLYHVQKLQTLLGYLCAILVVLILLNIAVRIGLCQNIYNRMIGRINADDENDRERLILLRS